MRIVFLSDDFPPQSFGGAGISTYDLALGVKKAGHDVSVITTCRDESEEGEFNYKNLKIWRITVNYPERWRACLSIYNRKVSPKLEERLKEIKPDVVHINNVHFYLSYHSIKIAKRHARVVVMTFRDAMAFSFGKLNTSRYLKKLDCRTTWLDHLRQARKRWNPFRNLLIRRYVRHADKLFSVSEALKKALSQNGIKNVEVMRTGVDVDSWQADKEQTDKFRAKFNLKNKKVLLFGGRLSEAKGGRKTLEVMAEAVKHEPNAMLLVVSRADKYTEEMKREACNLGIASNVVTTGWIEREDMKYAYASADVVLVPSICFDAFPRTVVEAMASGKPVIGTCYGGAKEAIKDGVTGYVINPFDTRNLTKKVVDLLKNPEKAVKFGRAAKEAARKDFSLDQQVRKLLGYCQR